MTTEPSDQPGTRRDDVSARAAAWMEQDPDPVTRAELGTLVQSAGHDEAAAADLADRFSGRLEFGTAGLRGALGAGPNRMNRVVVAQAAAGLAAYLLDTVGKGASVVIGYDARHNSDVFARDTAHVMAGVGVRASMLPRPLPTPVLAFAIRHLGCSSGVMVTASHNPPQDNGYKVYLGDGSQIVPPADAAIAAAIGAVGPVTSLPRSDDYQILDESVVDAYVAAVAAVAPDGPRDVSVVYTPLHGVGASVVRAVLERTGYGPVHETPAQAEPDPDFPTVAFPNPEEPGAIDLATAVATEVDADLVIANDPDADRCAVAVPDDLRGWRMLRGDEVGALLADACLRRGVTGTYATTIVSSSLLSAMATAHGQPYVETLTGFKWIGRVPGLAFGYEEALGYCVAPHVARDKDGISALVHVLALAASLRAEGRTLVDRLDEIAEQHGLYATDQLSARVSDLTLIGEAMDRLRDTPPRVLGGLTVNGIDDLAAGSDTLPPTDGLRFRLADGARVVVRPSGTEPKLKAYLEVVMSVGDGVPAARVAAAGRLDAIRSDVARAAGI